MKALLRVILVLLLALLIMNLSGGIAMAISKAIAGNKTTAFISGAVMQTGLLIFSLSAMLLIGKGKLAAFGFVMPVRANWRSIVLLGFGVGLCAATILTFVSAGEDQLDLKLSTWQSILLIWIYASTCEEIFTRGLIQGSLLPLVERGMNVGRLRISLPVLTGATFFGLMHLSLLMLGAPPITVLLIVVFAFVLGVIAGYQREKTGSLLPAIAIHSLFNINGFLVSWIAGH
ncbi:MAG: CPBP family intramembrane metalloprotease [candidate division Zixibacteria bacterium]|nr:CPBP family intramembrane metalloprotease [candidate division Zixibacteria bacterium]